MAVETALAFLLWQKLPMDIPCPRGSQYAIRFSIVVQHSYFPLALASFLVRFIDHHGAYANGQLQLIRLCYQFANGSIVGVMFFNGALERSFEVVRYEYSRHIWARSCFDRYGLWLSVWLDCPFYTPFPSWIEVEQCIILTK